MKDELKMKVYSQNGVQIIETELQKKILEKVTKEYNKFVEDLLKERPEVIIERAYEKVCKQEMIYVFEKQNLSVKESKALLKRPNILDECYDDWLSSGGQFYELLETPIDDSIKHIVEDYERKSKNKDKGAR